MELLKGMAGRIATGLLALLVVAAGISWWQMEPPQREAVVAAVGRIGAWVGIVLLVPWVGFALIGWVARRESNAAGAVLVGGITIVELIALGFLFDWSFTDSGLGWAGFAVGGLFAAAYNLLACDWIAERLS